MRYPLLFLFLLISMISYGQLVDIPDPKFKLALINQGVDTNNDGEIQVSEAEIIDFLDIRNRSISSIVGIEHFVNLFRIRAGNNDITAVENLPSNLEILSIQNNGLQHIDLSNLTKLGFFYAPDNEFVELDLSNSQNLFSVYICRNSELEYLNIKTNVPFLNEDCNADLLCIRECPKLKTVCCNPEDLECVILENNNEQPVDITPFCGSENVNSNIELSSYFHFAGSNCDSIGEDIGYMRYEISDGTSTLIYLQSDTAQISVPVSSGNYTVRPLLDVGDCVSIIPEIQTFDITNDSMQFDASFCISPSKDFKDLETTLIPLDEARADGTSSYLIEVRNTGTTMTSGKLFFHFQELTSELVLSSPLEDERNTNQLIWTLDNLAPFESLSYYIELKHNGPQDSPPLNVDSTLAFNTVISSSDDEYAKNDTSIIEQTVINSFDPNDKTCLDGELIFPNRIGEYLTYRIRFENLGTANALDVIIIDTLDQSQLDSESIYVMESSHPVTTTLEEDILTFDFSDIDLSFEEGFNFGYVIFRIKTKSELAIGDTIQNRAAIYFDSNFPIITNRAQTIIKDHENYDYDYDGFGSDDCDNFNADINPNQTEEPYNGIDDDCNPETLDDDIDQDGFLLSDDCDDNNSSINPNQTEEPYNGIDDDCNPETLDDDIDQDGFLLSDDCDDNNSSINPNQTEEPYNGVDDDCNPETLDDDIDQDGFLIADDCNDDDSSINPNAEEIPNNGIDENCDGMDLISSTDNLNNTSINIYPNPANDIVYIDVVGKLDYTSKLYNLDGKLILSKTNTNQLYVNPVPSGLYILEITDQETGEMILSKILVER